MRVGRSRRTARSGWSASATAFVLASLLGACSSAAGQGGVIDGTHWLLRSYLAGDATVTVPDTVTADLAFDRGEASGSDGCNHFSGTYTASGSSLEFGQLATTAMGCLAPGVQPGYMAALGDTASYTATAAALTLFDKNGARLAAFVAAPANASPSPSPSAIASPAVVCDTAQPQPTPSLTCGPAVAAALAALAPGHPPVVRAEFRWGGLCPPGAPCAPPLGDAGIVIVDFASGPPVLDYVSADASGAVSASSPAPYPSGY